MEKIEQIKHINLDASTCDLLEVLKKENINVITLYNKNEYVGYIETQAIKNIIIKEDLNDIYITINGAGIWCDLIHAIDIETKTFYHYTLKEDLFYEQEM